jgi:hypothetical protein
MVQRIGTAVQTEKYNPVTKIQSGLELKNGYYKKNWTI